MACTKLFISLTLLGVVVGSIAGAARTNAQETADNTPPRPFFSLPSLNFSLPTINLPTISLPQLPSFSIPSIPNPFPPAALIKATKTEYVEVTRRQTIHPVCYTAHKLKAPCLPVRHHNKDEAEGLEFNAEHQVHENIDVNRERPLITPTKVVRMVEPTADYDIDVRSPKYLEFRERQPPKEKTIEDIVVETSEGAISVMRNPFQRQTTEYVTKTVLVTKLERFTDHRVTATLVALNCLPVDPKIPKCHSHKASPIIEEPDQSVDYAESVPSSVTVPPPIEAADDEHGTEVVDP